MTTTPNPTAAPQPVAPTQVQPPEPTKELYYQIGGRMVKVEDPTKTGAFKSFLEKLQLSPTTFNSFAINDQGIIFMTKPDGCELVDPSFLQDPNSIDDPRLKESIIKTQEAARELLQQLFAPSHPTPSIPAAAEPTPPPLDTSVADPAPAPQPTSASLDPQIGELTQRLDRALQAIQAHQAAAPAIAPPPAQPTPIGFDLYKAMIPQLKTLSNHLVDPIDPERLKLLIQRIQHPNQGDLTQTGRHAIDRETREILGHYFNEVVPALHNLLTPQEQTALQNPTAQTLPDLVTLANKIHEKAVGDLIAIERLLVTSFEQLNIDLPDTIDWTTFKINQYTSLEDSLTRNWLRKINQKIDELNQTTVAPPFTGVPFALPAATGNQTANQILREVMSAQTPIIRETFIRAVEDQLSEDFKNATPQINPINLNTYFEDRANQYRDFLKGQIKHWRDPTDLTDDLTIEQLTVIENRIKDQLQAQFHRWLNKHPVLESGEENSINAILTNTRTNNLQGLRNLVTPQVPAPAAPARLEFALIQQLGQVFTNISKARSRRWF